jgi:hypothetical protein
MLLVSAARGCWKACCSILAGSTPSQNDGPMQQLLDHLTLASVGWGCVVASTLLFFLLLLASSAWEAPCGALVAPVSLCRIHSASAAVLCAACHSVLF